MTMFSRDGDRRNGDRDEEMVRVLAGYLEVIENGGNGEAVLRNNPGLEAELRELAGLDASLSVEVPEEAFAAGRQASRKFLATLGRESAAARALAWFRPRLFFFIGALGLGAGLSGAFASGALPPNPLGISFDSLPLVGTSKNKPPPPIKLPVKPQVTEPGISPERLSGPAGEVPAAHPTEPLAPTGPSPSQVAGETTPGPAHLQSESEPPFQGGTGPSFTPTTPVVTIDSAGNGAATVAPANSGQGNGAPENAGQGQGNGNGQPENPGQGNGNGQPENPGQGNGNGQPENPGQGEGNGQPENPGQGNGNGQPENPGQGNGNGQPEDPGQGNGQPENPGQGEGNPGGGKKE